MVGRYLKRLFIHLLTPPWKVRRVFPAHALRAIEAAIARSESQHRGEIRFAVEAGLDLWPLLRNQSARERAIEVFSELRVWDTEANNGCLIYLLLADHDVEIVADRGIAARVGSAEWARICGEMEALFRQGRFEEGVILGIHAITPHLAEHFPARPEDRDELENRPVLL
ncbi:MAG: TPM domain-containing protein [Acidobacteria bacterium]|nr:TPM domain-containing protein [Acidobacteriota bacterium]